MGKRVADVLIETLQTAGAKTCYGIVGDTLNRIAHAIDRCEIDWVHMRHEEAGAFAASAEAQLTGRLTVCAGTCGPGSLHFINGLYEANRNRSPVILIATQLVRQDIGFDSIQEIDLQEVFKGCSVFCETILTPEQARRKTVAACQAALTKRGVAVLVVPAIRPLHDRMPVLLHPDEYDQWLRGTFEDLLAFQQRRFPDDLIEIQPTSDLWVKRKAPASIDTPSLLRR